MMIAAIAMSIAIPGIAHAEAASEKPKMECCCKDMAKPMDCCEKHARGKAGQDEHAGHDMGQQPQPQH
jgi:hypothetical protein